MPVSRITKEEIEERICLLKKRRIEKEEKKEKEKREEIVHLLSIGNTMEAVYIAYVYDMIDILPGDKEEYKKELDSASERYLEPNKAQGDD